MCYPVADYRELHEEEEEDLDFDLLVTTEAPEPELVQ